MRIIIGVLRGMQLKKVPMIAAETIDRGRTVLAFFRTDTTTMRNVAAATLGVGSQAPSDQQRATGELRVEPVAARPVLLRPLAWPPGQFWWA